MFSEKNQQLCERNAGLLGEIKQLREQMAQINQENLRLQESMVRQDMDRRKKLPKTTATNPLSSEHQ